MQFQAILVGETFMYGITLMTKTDSCTATTPRGTAFVFLPWEVVTA